MWLITPNSWGSLSEVNHCHTHAPGHPCEGGEVKKRWHLTSDPHFKADPTFKPYLNRVFLSDLARDPKDQPAGLFVTENPEHWMHAHGYEQPYVAEVEGMVTNPPGSVRVGYEEFMQGEVKTVRVLTADEYARETFGEPGWVETYFAPLRRFGDKIVRFPNYVGRPVSEMTPAEIKEWERKFSEYAERPDGPRARARTEEE